LEVAAACLQFNSQERLKPVLEAFGLIGANGQQKLNFEGDPDEDDPEDNLENQDNQENFEKEDSGND
jgi:guanylate kinase